MVSRGKIFKNFKCEEFQDDFNNEVEGEVGAEKVGFRRNS